MRNVFLVLVFGVLFAGCGTKEPTLVYKDTYIPVKCDVEMPIKPENKGDFESHKARMVYYLECERLLRVCTKGDI